MPLTPESKGFYNKKLTLFKSFHMFSFVSTSRFCSLPKLTWGNMISRTAIDLINIVPLGEGNIRKFECIGPSSFVSKTNANDCNLKKTIKKLNKEKY